MKELIIEDPNGIQYTLHVTEDIYARAHADIEFCTRLFQSALKHNQEPDIEVATALDLEPSACLRSQPSTSSYQLQNSTLQLSNTASTQPDSVEGVEGDDDDDTGFRWSNELVLLLISIYKEKFEKIKIQKKLWELIAKKINEKGYHLTATQCKNKLNYLKKKYKTVKDHNEKSGNNREKWTFYDVMDDLYKDKPWIKPVCVLASSENIQPSQVEQENSAGNAVRPQRRIVQQRRRPLDSLITVMREHQRDRREMHRETITLLNRVMDIFQNNRGGPE